MSKTAIMFAFGGIAADLARDCDSFLERLVIYFIVATVGIIVSEVVGG
jgi:hypothetical protein